MDIWNWYRLGLSRAINCSTINRGKILHCLLEESKNPRRKIFVHLFFGLQHLFPTEDKIELRTGWHHRNHRTLISWNVKDWCQSASSRQCHWIYGWICWGKHFAVCIKHGENLEYSIVGKKKFQRFRSPSSFLVIFTGWVVSWLSDQKWIAQESMRSLRCSRDVFD